MANFLQIELQNYNNFNKPMFMEFKSSGSYTDKLLLASQSVVHQSIRCVQSAICVQIRF
jgi:hypothetical protein